MVSSFSSQRRINNALGKSGPSAASPNDVHHRCRWQSNDQILVLHVELQQELAQFPEAGQTSCFLSGLVRHGRCRMTPIGPLEAEWRQPIGPHRGISTAMKGDITHLGIVPRPSQNVPSFTPVERPMPSQNAAATHTRMCVLHREKGRCAPTPVKQHSAAGRGQKHCVQRAPRCCARGTAPCRGLGGSRALCCWALKPVVCQFCATGPRTGNKEVHTIVLVDILPR